MISAETLKTLDMLRRRPKGTGVNAPTKWPRGGRPNPCAEHREPRHPAAEARLRGRPNRRDQQLRKIDCPAWQRLVAAVERGDLPVGPVDTARIKQVIGSVHSLGHLAVDLANHRAPVRLRELNHKQWIIALL